MFIKDKTKVACRMSGRCNYFRPQNLEMQLIAFNAYEAIMSRARCTAVVRGSGTDVSDHLFV